MQPCEVCGKINVPGARYCMSCASPLLGAQSSHESSSGWHSARSSVEQFAPVIEDFAWDMVRAGVKLYYGLRDNQMVVPPTHRSLRHRFERLRDVMAEARVDHRRRYDHPGDGRYR